MDDLWIFVLALVSEYSEFGLDEVAALGDVLCGFHLVSGEHPHLDV